MKREVPHGVRFAAYILFATVFGLLPVSAQTLEQRLLTESPATLVQAAKQSGDAKRGAIVFYQPFMACSKCHVHGDAGASLGPDLTSADDATSQEAKELTLVESLLYPSRVIRQGFETVTAVMTNGQSLVGLIEHESADSLVLRDATQPDRRITIPRTELDEILKNTQSIMPAGQVNQLASRQQFLDLLRYLMEISAQGVKRASELQPPPSAYAARPLPEYESDIDHAGMIRRLDDASFRRGEAIYNRLCINCHGTHDKEGSLPTSLRFASGKFKSGNDPFTMYQTLTRGFGMMVPQAWMVPQQKYDAIHYIREAYLKKHNPTEYFDTTADYLAALPRGTTFGPEPSNIFPWEQMDYGHNLVATYEVGTDRTNFAYKGNAIRLDPGPGGVSQGRHWMIFDYDTMRMAGAWTGKGFIDWNGINFNGRHGIHPRIIGKVSLANPTGPGWANPVDGKFDDPRLRGRDDRAYGPLPRDWAHYKGMYYHGQRVILSYTVGTSRVLELPGITMCEGSPVFTRTFNIGPRSTELLLRVASEAGETATISSLDVTGKTIRFGQPDGEQSSDEGTAKEVEFNGATRIEISDADDFEMRDRDFTITARVKTSKGGTIFAKTSTESAWVPNGKTLFVRGGKLAFDIGWVGVVQSKTDVGDGQWHDVAATYSHEPGTVTLYVDGKPNGSKSLKPKDRVADHVARIGFTSDNFPGPESFFEGSISEVCFYDRVLTTKELTNAPDVLTAAGAWSMANVVGERVEDQSGNKHVGKVIKGSDTSKNQMDGPLIAGLVGKSQQIVWANGEASDLLLKIPRGEDTLRFAIWATRAVQHEDMASLASRVVIPDSDTDLNVLTKGGPPRWTSEIKTQVAVENTDGPFAIDDLSPPFDNPWFCRMRLTGFDFYPDGDRAAVSSWDGSVWLVSGLASLPSRGASDAATADLTWQRIASGLFQPLGVKIVDGKIHVSCRDQICILHDLNGDEEIDYYENFNNDHQVTDHFHEFAMGLQTDARGNFYYAKSARHALPALVPHHGTLLRVSPDGEHTDIIANGFRAANGVCVNPDGTFIVTDQEGHWNPKNRINWVREGGFYGNMFGYHDVTDSSDEAMEQPLCWITNEFDRSPAELLWVPDTAWGPLGRSLLNLSYGYGKVYVVPHEEIDGQMQGGMCPLPIPQFATGTMRGRFSPRDNQLYLCGMFAWGSNQQQQEGGFYRLRYTGQPAHLPLALHARRDGIDLTFSDRLDPATARDPTNFAVKVWSLKRSANYGSKHFNEHELFVTESVPAADGRSVFLEISDMAPTWCMEIKYTIRGVNGESVVGVIHNTIHKLSE
ncbi:MAG: c-type cytochrome [Planctomycetaceae bacterium]|nr:c-type cytochrome [Planctomycetales bacterium]MCB9923934.1 c-type cytochrome [Planctomycetaceae bacterium]